VVPTELKLINYIRMKRQLSRRHFFKDAAITSAAIVASTHGLNAGGPEFSSKETLKEKSVIRKKPKFYLNDGLCNPAITIRPCQLVSTVCVLGGAGCPLIEPEKVKEITDKLKVDPTTAIRLESNVDEIPRFTKLKPEELSSPDTNEVINKKRDLDVLQRLGLVPGDTRRARYLYELLFARIETPVNLCSYDTPGWKGCELAHSGAYEKIHKKGWQAVVYQRSAGEMAEYRKRNVDDIKSMGKLYVRPHHFMCFSCWYDGGKGQTPRPNDTLFEIWQRIKSNPDIPVTLVEGTCMACDCCDGFYPPSGRCAHSGGLVRDYKKDLDVFQKMGLMPGATMKARDVFALLFEKVPSTRDICGFGDGIVRSEEWRICSDPQGNPGYANTRRNGVF
jgi:hypothetical protein